MSQAGSASGGGGGGSTGILTLNYTQVSTTPYVVQSTDSFMGVETDTISITVQLPNAPTTGRVYIIKDISGDAIIHNITVTTVGGTVLIDGSTSIIMNTDLESLQFFFDGTEYFVF